MLRHAVPSLFVLVAVACATSPTGRRQLVMFAEPEMDAMGVAAYDKLKTEIPISQDSRQTAYVRCVADAITQVLGPDDGGPESWEVTLFQEDSANAFALPGGKIGVHTGLLAVAKNRDQLATVLGHEVAHVLARHSNERMSTTSLAQTGLSAVDVIAGSTSPTQRQLIGLLGVGLAQYGVILPYGRAQESEADLIGLDLMARAGFDPRESIPLWQNMGAAGGSQPPEFLSTHPSHETRIDDLRERIPSALELRQRSGRSPRC